jgi:hypothetical protein
LVATILTLLFLPALYAAWFRVRRAKREPVGVLPQFEASTASPPAIVA